MRRARPLSLLVALVVALGALPPGVLAQGPFADVAFTRTWTRTDAPVSNGQASRTYYWGPCTSTPGGVTARGRGNEDHTHQAEDRPERPAPAVIAAQLVVTTPTCAHASATACCSAPAAP